MTASHQVASLPAAISNDFNAIVNRAERHALIVGGECGRANVLCAFSPLWSINTSENDEWKSNNNTHVSEYPDRKTGIAETALRKGARVMIYVR